MPQKRRKSAYVWLWVLALAALSAAVSISHYIYPILSTQYLIPSA